MSVAAEGVLANTKADTTKVLEFPGPGGAIGGASTDSRDVAELRWDISEDSCLLWLVGSAASAHPLYSLPSPLLPLPQLSPMEMSHQPSKLLQGTPGDLHFVNYCDLCALT